MTSLEERARHELLHGRKLLEGGGPEAAWGWNTAAGRVRALRRAKLIADAAGLRNGMRVVEVGCGTGLFTELFAKYRAQILAIDISPDLLNIAKQRNLDSGLVEFREMRFEDSQLEGPFDAIIGSSALHHLDLQLALQTMFKLLRPRGVLAFAEPNMLNPQIWGERNMPLARKASRTSPDETAIIRWSLANKLRRVGYVAVSIRNVDWLHPRTPAPLIRPLSLLGFLLERLPILREFSGSVLIRAERPG